jgi:hypothetical protein
MQEFELQYKCQMAWFENKMKEFEFEIQTLHPFTYNPEGPKRRPEGGEWEPIKIPYEIWPISQNRPKSATNAISLQNQEHMLHETKNH